MADDEWQLEAVHEQFNVFDNLTTTYENIQSNDFRGLFVKVEKIKTLHLKMNNINYNTRHISSEIIKHPDGDGIKLSFIVIVTNIKINGSLSKMPIFVIMSGNNNKFIDMNCTLFNSFDAFLKQNDFPPCQYCFPDGGRYSVGGKLKIDFGSSPAAYRQNRNFIWKSLGFVVAVGIVAASFFYSFPPIDHSYLDPLLRIANEFVPGINKFVGTILKGVAIVEKLKSGSMDIVEVLPELWNLLKWVNDNFSEEISWVFNKVQNALWKLYSWLREKLSPFANASASSQHMFMAVTSRVDKEIVNVESDTEEVLEASIKNNCRSQTTVVASAIHAQVNNGGTGYTKTIFRNVKKESALNNGMKKDSENLRPATLDLLELSKSVAETLGKRSLNEHKDVFEAVSCIVIDEYKNKIQLHSKMLAAAKASAGHRVDVEAFNCTLGIKGDVKEHYWQEAMMSVMKPRLAYWVKEKMESLESEKELLILPLYKHNENDVPGVYRLVGVYGGNKFTANDLTKALRKIQIDLSERELVINETSSMIMVLSEDLTLSAMQELNSENTSEGVLLVVRTEI